MALKGKTSLRVNYKLEEKIFDVTMAGKRSFRKAILYTYPSSFRTNEVALRNRLFFIQRIQQVRSLFERQTQTHQ